MGGAMEMMECCKRARAHGNTPDVQAARLCCALNCQNGGGSGPASTARVTQPPASPAHPAAADAPAPFVVARASRGTPPSHPNESPPVYLLNLAFLI